MGRRTGGLQVAAEDVFSELDEFMRLLKKLLPFCVVGLAVFAYFTIRQKPPVDPAKEIVARRSTPSAPVRGVPKREPGRPKSSRDLLPAGMRHDFDLQEKGYLAAKVGIDEVLEILGGLESDRDRESFLRGAFRRAADLDVPEALNWARRLSAGAPRDAALLTLFVEWSGITVTSAFLDARIRDSGIAVTLGHHLLASGGASPEEVIALANDFVSSFQAKIYLIGEAAGKLAATDRAKALAIGDQFSGVNLQLFQYNFAQSWARHDLQGALQWVGEIPDVQMRANLKSIMVRSLAAVEVGSAARLIQSVPPGEERNQFLNDLSAKWAAKDTRSALQWAESLADETERSSVLEKIRSTVPVGIGVAMTGDRISKVWPGSPASRSGLVAGDRIIAFSTAEGKWVETHGDNISSMANEIRGAANKTVSLRVEAKDGGTLRNITLTREPLMMLEE